MTERRSGVTKSGEMRTLWLALFLVACSRPHETPRRSGPPPEPPASAPPPPLCEPAPEVVYFVAGQRVIAWSDAPMEGQLRTQGGSSSERHGGPPYFWIAKGAEPVTFVRGACPDARPRALRAAPRGGSKVWASRATWNADWENLYAAWIEHLFDAADDEQPTWAALSDVIRDDSRNLLFDALGLAEDSGRKAPFLRPDCADLPYFLRAYFAWKMALPFGVGECSRGGHGAPPSCHGLTTNEDPDDRVLAERTDVASFGAFVRGTVANRVHSGSARAPFDDEAADHYPVRLTWETLRPGMLYADPYGHVLVIAKRVAQTETRGGILFAVDGQPDGTVSRKRFWQGNFLYSPDRTLGGAGFKRFRPLVRRGGHLVRADYGDAVREPPASAEEFYDAMEDVLSPRPREAARALLEIVDALEEQLKARVVSIENGRKWLASADRSAPMPEGPEIFETSGPWEDFATPSRDLRLLIAMDVAEGFPARATRRAPRYGAASEPELRGLLTKELERRSITYTRTDGSPFTLTLAEILSRKGRYEVAYDPNDCVEWRWGAPLGSAEASTCRAHAPAEQRARMEGYRPWFRERRRPPRR
jgi:hypothetical protein